MDVYPKALANADVPWRDFGEISHHGSQTIKAQTGLWCGMHAGLMFRAQAQDRVSVFWIVEGDAFYGTGECIHALKYTRHNTVSHSNENFLVGRELQFQPNRDGF